MYDTFQLLHSFSYNLGQITEKLSITFKFIIKLLVFNSLPLIRKSNMGFIIVMCCHPEADIHVKQEEHHRAFCVFTDNKSRLSKLTNPA